MLNAKVINKDYLLKTCVKLGKKKYIIEAAKLRCYDDYKIYSDLKLEQMLKSILKSSLAFEAVYYLSLLYSKNNSELYNLHKATVNASFLKQNLYDLPENKLKKLNKIIKSFKNIPPAKAPEISANKSGLRTISILGSCRVHSPLKSAAKFKMVKLNNTGLQSYLHTVKEVIQKLDFAEKKITFPEHLDILINGTKETDFNLPFETPLNILKSDAFIIEISSIKQLQLNGYYLQLNYFMEYFIKPNKLEDWWREMVNLANKNGTAQITPTNPDLANDVRDLAASTVLTIHNQNSITKAVEDIYNRINKPILFVSHFNYGTPIKERVLLEEYLTNACANNPMLAVWNPGEYITKHGVYTTLMPNSSNHWLKSVYRDVGTYISNVKITELLNKTTAERKTNTK